MRQTEERKRMHNSLGEKTRHHGCLTSNWEGIHCDE
jgi:hypothetical protein